MLEGSMILSSFFFRQRYTVSQWQNEPYTTQGQGEPFIMVNPRLDAPAARSQEVVSSLDFVPTILDAAKIEYPAHAQSGHRPALLTGTSLISSQEDRSKPAFASHQFHSLYCYHPMRSATTGSSPGAKLEL